MKRLLNALSLTAVVSVAFLAISALADKVVTYRRTDARINVVELRPLADGGVSLSANVQFPESDGGAGYSREGSCDVSALTSAQKTCLIGIRNAALSCVADTEVGP